MKNYIALLALLALPACIGGGGGVDLTPSAPEASVTAEIGTALQGARAAGLSELTYNSQVGRIAQDHANDMFERNYLSIFERDSTDGTASDLRRDMGDDLNDANLRWDEIVQMVAQGDMTVVDVYAEFETRGREVEGDIASKLNGAMEFDEPYEFFGLGKAGSGDNQRWALLLVDPMDYWSER